MAVEEETLAQGHKRWHELITSRITDTVKLVGPTISCEGSPKDGNVNGEWRTNPHVQSYVLATDQVCHLVMSDAMSYGIGAAAGFKISDPPELGFLGGGSGPKRY